MAVDFNKKLDVLNEGVTDIREEKRLYREMHEVADTINMKGLPNNATCKKEHIWRVKDYVHYYGNDWAEGNPLVPEKDVKWRCRLAGPFRSIFKAIVSLRECDRLDLLDPILTELEKNGIHIKVDKNELAKRENFDNVICAMSDIQKDVCDVADHKRDEIRESAVKAGLMSKNCFNELTRALVTIQDKPDKMPDVDEHVSEKMASALTDGDNYTKFKSYMGDLK